MQYVCINRFVLMTEQRASRRKILRWLFLNFRVYEFHDGEPEIHVRFVSQNRFPEKVFRDLTFSLRGDRTLRMRIISYDLCTTYVEANVFRLGRWDKATL